MNIIDKHGEGDECRFYRSESCSSLAELRQCKSPHMRAVSEKTRTFVMSATLMH